MLEDIDRRERSRRRLRQPVTTEWQGRQIAGEATELSQDSIFVEAESPPPEDAEVSISIGAGADALRVRCRVRRASAGGFAGEFEAVSPEQRAALEKLLTSLPY